MTALTNFVQCMHAYLHVDRVVGFSSIGRVHLGNLDDSLCVVQEEHAKQHKAAIYGHGVEACTQSCGRWQEKGTWKPREKRGISIPKAVIQRHEYAACEANKNMVSLFLKLQWETSYAYSACEAIENKVSMFLKLQWERGTQGL